MSKIKILIADDHTFIIDGIVAMLNNNDDIEVIGEANNGEEVIKKFDLLNPDVVIMDISMPILSGIEATKVIISKHQNAKIIALTQHDDSEYIIQFIKVGGLGYLLKNSKRNEFIEAIKTVFNGEKYFSKSVSEIMINNLSNSQKGDEAIPLTKREIEIIKLIANDNSNQEIADKLNISLRTVETHRRNLMQKLNVKTAVALIRYAVLHNIIKLQ